MSAVGQNPLNGRPQAVRRLTTGSSLRGVITSSEVEKVLKKTKTGKAAGQSGVMSEMFAAADELGLEWLTDLCNKIVTEGKIPEHWEEFACPRL